MDKKLGIVLVLMAVSIMTMTTIVSASYTYTEETVMSNMGDVQCTRIHHWTGDDAETKAKYIDSKYYLESHLPGVSDGNCQFDELKKYVREEFEKPEKENTETENVFIDGIRGEIIDVDCDAGYERGYADIKKDITITCTYTLKWNLEDTNEHVYSRVGLEDNNAITFIVPGGWIIDSVEDLKGSSIRSDKTTVSGLAVTDKTHVITFTKASASTPSPSPTPAPAPSPTPAPTLTPTPSPTPTPIVTPTLSPTPTPASKTPGFEAIFAVSGLLAVAYLVLRGRR